MYEELYNELTRDERELLHNKRYDIANSSLSSKTEPLESAAGLDWLAIFEPYFKNNNKYLMINSTTAYYRSEDVDDYFPQNPEGPINHPFDIGSKEDQYRIIFVQTSTNTKIYEYAKLLVDSNISYIAVPYADRLLVQHQKHKIKTLKNENVIIILTNELNNKLLHETLAIFPSLFSISELQQNENIINCCRAVINKQSIKPYFQKMFDNLQNEKKEEFKREVKNMLTANKRSKITELDNNIERTRRNIRDYINSLDSAHERLQSLLNEKVGAEVALTDNPKTLDIVIDFLNNNKYIKNAYFKNYNIGYGYKNLLVLELEAPITLYETEPLLRYYESLQHDFGETGQEILKTIKEIFVNEEYQMYCTTIVYIDVESRKFDACPRTTGVEYSKFNKMPQPHLTFFNCWGDSDNNIKQALREDNLVDAIQLMLIAVQNINFTDITVFRRWINNIMGYSSLMSKKCVKDNSDNWYSLPELFGKLKETNQNTETISESEE